MSRSIFFVTLSAALVTVLSLPACDRPAVVTVPATTIAVPGPAGPQGETGAQGMTGDEGMQGNTGSQGEPGKTGKTGDATTVIVVPPAAPAN